MQPLASSLSQAAEGASMLSGCALAATQCAGSSGGAATAVAVAVGARVERDALIAMLQRATMVQVGRSVGMAVRVLSGSEDSGEMK